MTVSTADRQGGGGPGGLSGDAPRAPADDGRSSPALEAYEAVPEMLCVLDASGTFVYGNERWREALGHAPAQLRGTSWLALVHPTERQGVEDASAAVFAGTSAAAVLGSRARRSDGAYRWVRWSLRGEHGRVIALVSDVTEQRNTFEQFRLSVEASPTGMLMVDGEGKIALVNRQLELLFGYERRELLGHRIELLIPERYRGRHVASRDRFLGAPTARSMGQGRDLFGVRKDGSEFAIEIGLNPLSSEAGATVLASIVDISERKRQESELRARVDDLQRHREEMDILSEMSSLLQHAIEEREAHEIVASFGRRLLQCRSVSIYVVPPSRDALERVAGWGEQLVAEDRFAPTDCWALRRAQVHRSALRSPPRCAHGRSGGGEFQLCIPMSAHGQSLVVIALSVDAETDERARTELELLGKAAADQLGLALSNIHLREELRGLSIRDPLTGLFNRRYLDESALRELPRAKRRQSTVAVLMIDVDHFKRYNDTRGHQAADQALRQLADVLRARTRTEDIVCRYGGEEFVVLLPDCPLQDGLARAEHLRAEASRFSGGEVTLSIGVSEWPTHGDTWEMILGAADRALYQAKASGRDRVLAAT